MHWWRMEMKLELGANSIRFIPTTKWKLPEKIIKALPLLFAAQQRNQATNTTTTRTSCRCFHHRHHDSPFFIQPPPPSSFYVSSSFSLLPLNNNNNSHYKILSMLTITTTTTIATNIMFTIRMIKAKEAYFSIKQQQLLTTKKHFKWLVKQDCVQWEI